MQDFYVYLHRRKSNNKVFYVGKGTGNRAYQIKNRTSYWKNIVNKHGFIVEIVQNGLHEWYAFELEINLIAYYGRKDLKIGELVNCSDGGEGSAGRIVGENEKTIKSNLFRGRRLLESTKKLISLARAGKTGHKHTEESKKRMSQAKKGIKTPWNCGDKNHMKSDKQRERMSKLWKGVKKDYMLGDKNPMANPELREKARLARIGIKLPQFEGAGNPSAKAVICVETNITYATMKEAAEWLISIGKTKNIKSANNICSACGKKLKKAYGYTWKYA